MLLLSVGSRAQTGGTTKEIGKQVQYFAPDSPESIVAERNFFVLTASGSGVRRVLDSDPVLGRIRMSRSEALATAGHCKSAACFDEAFRWSDGDVSAIAEELRRLYGANDEVRNYANVTLRGSGRYPLYKNESGADLLATAWTDAARGINHILDVYGDGDAPLYPKIDSIRFDAKSKTYVEVLAAITMMVAQESAGSESTFDSSLKDAVMLLATNDRLDAARLEPLDKGDNAPAIAKGKRVDWARYPYSVILVPGQGPAEPDVELSPLGRVRVEQAARLYRAGKAPFIVLSGGTVHPMLTRFCEALEMRTELMTEWHVPEDAILIDPYARHTTTNIRNTVREIERYGLPMGKPVLITSDFKQVDMIMDRAFDARCEKELHYVPYSGKKRLSATEIEMRPKAVALQVDSMDPLDP